MLYEESAHCEKRPTGPSEFTLRRVKILSRRKASRTFRPLLLSDPSGLKPGKFGGEWQTGRHWYGWSELGKIVFSFSHAFGWGVPSATVFRGQ